MEGFLIRRWNLVVPSPGYGGTSMLSHWANLPQPTKTQPVGLGFLYRVGRYRPGGSLFLSPIGRI